MTGQLNLNLGNQRWRARRDSYRRPDEPIRTSAYDVVELPDDTRPKGFVIEHHYSASYPSARFRFGLFRGDALEGVAVFSHPCGDNVLTNVFGGIATDSVELGRFVLLDEVAGNGETWFLARCFEQLQGRVTGVLSFSDPLPRRDTAGALVMPGHVGTIYQAHNARYLGRATPRTLRVLPNGTVLNARAKQKVLASEKGTRYVVEVLCGFGAEAPRDEDLGAWMDRWTKALTRPVRHPGNHRYAWGLTKTVRRYLPASLPYPKKDEVRA